MGFLRKKDEYRNAILKIVGWKLIYYSYALVIPLIIVPLPWWIVVLAFLSMHFVTGLLISIVFQVAHIEFNEMTPFKTLENQFKIRRTHRQKRQ